MSATGLVVRRELRSLLRRPSLRIAGLVVTLLALIAAGLQAARHSEDAAQRARLQELVWQQWLEQPDRHPHRVAHYGSYAFRPPGPLTFVSSGIDGVVGTTLFLEAHQRNLASFSDAAQASELARFGNLDLALVVEVIVPLLLFCFCFSSVAGERERGTWLLMLAQGVSGRRILLGKILAAWLLGGLWLVVILAMAGLGAAAAGALEVRADLIQRAALVGVTYLLYVGVAAALGVLVSALHQRARSALASLLVLWIALFVVAPRLASEAAVGLLRAPSRAAFEMQLARALRAAGDSHDPNNPHFRELERRTLAEHGVTRVEELPVNYNGIVMHEGERVTAAIHDAAYERVYATHSAQNALALALAPFAPRLAASAVVLAAAGSDEHHFAHFEAQAEAYRYSFIQRLNELHTTHIRQRDDRAQRVSRDEWTRFEPFTYARPPVSWALGQTWPAALALLGWAAVLAATALLPRWSRP